MIFFLAVSALIGSSVQPQLWWLNATLTNAFKMGPIDAVYNTNYFVGPEANHPKARETQDIVTGILHVYRIVMDRKLRSVIEFGAAHGHFTKAFAAAGLDYEAVEGSRAAVALLKRQPGVSASRVHLADLRLPIVPRIGKHGQNFDLAICTEVGEHIELPFHSQLVRNLIRHSNLVYFTFHPPEENEKSPEYTHPSEMPLRYWLNLFDFHGFGAFIIGENNGILPPRFFAYRRANVGHLLSSNLRAKMVPYKLHGTDFTILVLGAK
mmetsp:Transcript_45887/g.75875  ORF Transcript_45887/g.75875 Transcript_45887/m.75875 type:complete len:266 (-) Transcript_45887:160-957(-)|eukprot:CAMPEP_0119314888 /NCGR_PEP_ID=MMETSP1333-20130426/34084_1 /TAXON_ID=418940 /ORGANISM="Scyphosphaera apsteinii, Strain RCC1455" /LENGTH=265 /DNA_ID=CAMNT_0007320087 /DNA_START=58 /DNA_END=855 /DNA_ORIENTATION=+